MTAYDKVKRTPARLPSGVPVRIVEHHYAGEGDGPTVYVQAAQHGREINGTEVLRRLHDRLLSEPLAGNVIAVPVANPLTFDRGSYTTPEPLDHVEPNMNRIWPGDSDGTLHEQMAAGLWSSAEEADFLIDLHTATGATLPHIVYTAGDDAAERIAAAFGTDLLLAEFADEGADAEWHDRSFGGKFRVAAHRAEIPCITPELGDSRWLDESAVELGMTGVLNVLRAVGSLPGEPVENGRTERRRNHLARSRAEESGLFRPAPERELGERVEADQHLGTLYAPESYEVIQEATADEDGILYALTREAVVAAGDRLANVAIPLEES